MVLIVILLSSTTFAGLTTARAADAAVNQSLTTAAAGSNSTQALSNAAVVSTSSTPKKYIVFRDDDIQPNYYLDTLEAVNQVHIDENVPVTLSIIPHINPNLNASTNELLGDTSLLDYLRSIENSPLFEFAQHGYTHQEYSQKNESSAVEIAGTPPGAPLVSSGVQPGDLFGLTAPLVGSESPSEFYGRPYAAQYDAIKQGRDDMIQAFGVTPTTFVPPWNTGDDNTLKACHALGFTLYSTSPADFNTYNAVLQGIHVQGIVLWLGWSNDTDWQTGMSQLMQQTNALLNKATTGGTFTVLYHYADFNNASGLPDPTRIALFTQYIDDLKDRGDVLFSTLSDQPLLNPYPAPAAYSPAENSLDVFAQGTYQALWDKAWNGTAGWSSWEYLGGSLTAPPAAVSPSAGMIDVFARGGGGALWEKTTTNGGSSWTAWTSLGGTLAPNSGPAACSSGSGRLDVFVTGAGGALWWKYWNGSSWSAYQSLGGKLTSGPAAVSPSAGVIDVFARGGGGALWEKTTTNGGATWSAWTSLGGTLAPNTGPTACSSGSGHLDVFVEGAGGALWYKTYSGTSWSAYQSLGGPLGGKLASSPAAASALGSGRIDVFVRGDDNDLWQKTYNNGWSPWTSDGEM